MASQVEMPLLRNPDQNPVMSSCNGHCRNDSSPTPLCNEVQNTKVIGEIMDESPVTQQCNGVRCGTVIPVSKTCNRSNRCLSKRPSRDSGVGCSLNTIDEHVCCCGHDQKETEETESQPRNPSESCSCHGREAERAAGLLIRNSSVPTFQSYRSEQSFNNNRNERLEIPFDHCTDQNFRGNQMLPMTRLPNGRTRSKSESCQDYGPREANSLVGMERSREFEHIPSCSSADGEYDEVKYENSEKGEAKTQIVVRRDKCAWIAILILSILVVLTVSGILVIVVQFRLERDVEMKKMENKIFVLEQSIKKLNQTPSPPSFNEIRGSRGDVRPHAHLVLLGENNIAGNQFGQKVLQWTFGVKRKTSERLLGYNNKSRSITVQEPGLYFVYNQVYVFRNVVDTGKKMDHMYNHTLLHIIYRKPANFPSHRRPYIVTESALTQCWDEKANNQIHTSYHGVIVKLQLHDQLFVALENYNEEFDKLVDSSTYFGAFKI